MLAHPSSAGTKARLLMLGAPAFLGAGIAGYLFLRTVTSISTDDAEVHAHISPLSAQVGGLVVMVAVENNQVVRKGDVLLRIDDKDACHAELEAVSVVRELEVSVAIARQEEYKAKAMAATQLSRVNAQLAAAESRRKASYMQSRAGSADLDSSEALVQQQERLTELSRELYSQGLIARQAFEDSVAALRVAKAKKNGTLASDAALEATASQDASNVDVAMSNVKDVRSYRYDAGIAHQRVNAQEAALAAAKVRLMEAQLNRQRTIVTAPFSGIVAARVAENGQLVKRGDPLMSLVNLSTMWVQANFKETQLSHLAVGSRAHVRLDASGTSVAAHIASIQPGSGSVFTLLPPDNASGNFVKVVQRVPVRLQFDGQPPSMAMPGMSVVVTIAR